MALTNFESNIRTAKLQIAEGYDVCVVINRLITAKYTYVTKALGSGKNIHYEVIKHEKSGKLIGNTIVKASYHGINYPKINFIIPNSIAKAIVEFHRDMLK